MSKIKKKLIKGAKKLKTAVYIDLDHSMECSYPENGEKTCDCGIADILYALELQEKKDEKNGKHNL